MISDAVVVAKYTADEGKVFDWAEARYDDILDEEGNVTGQEQQHLYAKTLYIGKNDSIDNYIEVEKG